MQNPNMNIEGYYGGGAYGRGRGKGESDEGYYYMRTLHAHMKIS
jgi:hypothetical protein